MKKLLLIVIVMLVMSGAVFATSDINYNKNVFVNNTHIGNLYVIGSSINVPANVTGDLMAMGSDIKSTGLVNNDVTLVGSNIVLDDVVGGAVRVAGNSISVNSSVFGDLVLAGMDVNVHNDTLVGGNTYLAGSIINVKGTHSGNLIIKGSIVYVDAEIDGNAEIAASRITWGKNARINGNLTISDNLAVADNVVKGNISSVPYSNSFVGRSNSGKGFWDVVLSGVMILVLGLVFGLVLKNYKKGVMVTIMQRPWISVLLGLTALILTPIVAFLLLITIVGMPLGVILFFVYGIMLILAIAVGAMYLGSLAFRIVSMDGDTISAFVLGIVLFLVLPLIPFIGGLIVFIAALMGLGSLTRNIFGADKPKKVRRSRARKKSTRRKKSAKKAKKKRK